MFSREKELSKIMVPPVYLLICLSIQYSLHNYFPVSRIIPNEVASVGLVLIFIGLSIDIWSAILFLKADTTIKPYLKPKHIVRSGMFRISRNPMYLGMAILLTGVALYFGTITPFVGPILFVMIINTLIIPREEYKMERLFGESYLEYKNSVRRWI